MSLTYDGIIHRSLEEQVRYDAEQVQLLKQADVTINESLQTINTEISNKLTKPTNPSAESAVTMLADGTVGTKPLSEIGGSGGKVYQHILRFHFDTNDSYIETVLYNNISRNMGVNDLPSYYMIGAYINNNNLSYGVVYFNLIRETAIDVKGVVVDENAITPAVFLNSYTAYNLTDTYTEL